MFRGILIEKDDAGYRATLKDIDEARLPEAVRRPPGPAPVARPGGCALPRSGLARVAAISVPRALPRSRARP
jgi:hypothetical protein